MNPTPLAHAQFNFPPLSGDSGNMASTTPPPAPRTQLDPSASPPLHTGSPPVRGGEMPPVAPIISPVVVDTLARDFGLEPKQIHLLRTFVGLPNLEKLLRGDASRETMNRGKSTSRRYGKTSRFD
ncbi:hypothetical protein B0H14DRAFT_2564441 [Mycena olivaceomarginata]|nr:hypothetical protein B0H14DRAFT_2564441 [Mycena olivaceomarginata]